MHLRVLTLPYSRDRDGIDDTELRTLSENNEVLGVSEHFTTLDGLPVLILLVRYRPRTTDGKPRRPSAAQPDPREGLSAEELALYEHLRSWRNDQARATGQQRYNVLRNADLAAIVRARPRSRADLLAVPGIGPARVAAFGDMLLELVRAHPVPPESSVDSAAAQSPGETQPETNT